MVNTLFQTLNYHLIAITISSPNWDFLEHRWKNSRHQHKVLNKTFTLLSLQIRKYKRK